MSEISTIGLDLAKNVFQVHGVDRSGAVVLRRQLRRGAVEKFFAQLSPCTVGVEACGTSAPLGAGDRPLWPSGATDAAGVCETLSATQQERRPRHVGDLRAGQPTYPPIRFGEQ